MVGDGIDDPARNPDDNPRLAGRLSVSLLEPETSWFNQGSYLGEREVLSLKAGYLLPGSTGPGRIQPCGRYEWIRVDDGDDTRVGGLGLNYFVDGHANKLTVEARYVDPDDSGRPGSAQDRFLLTVQFAVGLQRPQGPLSASRRSRMSGDLCTDPPGVSKRSHVLLG